MTTIAEASAGVAEPQRQRDLYGVATTPHATVSVWAWSSRPLSHAERASLLEHAARVDGNLPAQAYVDAVVSLLCSIPPVIAAIATVTTPDTRTP